MTWPSVLLDWSFEPTVVVPIVLSAMLYWWGSRSSLKLVGSQKQASRRWRALGFYAGLLAILIALTSPVDTVAGSLFSFHMGQHILLIMVAAPLLVLGDAGVPLLRSVPLGIRRTLLSAAMRQQWIHRLGGFFSWVATPRKVVVIFLVDLYLWHWNLLFNLTLRNQIVHDAEHVCFLLTAVLFWSQVIDQRPIHARLSYGQRSLYLIFAAFSSNFLAMFLVFSPRVDYSAYANLTTRPFGMTTMGDQQIAGALMWIPVLFIFGGAFGLCFLKWLQEDASREVIPDPRPAYSVLLGPSDAGGRSV